MTRRETQWVGAGLGATTAMLAGAMVALSGGSDTACAVPMWAASVVALGTVASYVASTVHRWAQAGSQRL